MRIDRRELKANKITFIPENLTDLYTISNIIEKSDAVYATTTRRIRKSDKQGREGDKGERVKMFLGISVTDLEFQDTHVNQRLRVRGTIISGPDDVSLNSNHTLNIKENTKLTIQKENWSKIHFKIIKEAESAVHRPLIGLVALERGFVSMGIIDNYKIEYLIQDRQNVSNKLVSSKVRTNADANFFKKVLEYTKNYFGSDNIKNLLIGGPGKYKEKFHEYLEQNWPNHGKNILLEDISSGSDNGIRELVNRSTFEKLASGYQIVEESRIIQEFELLLIKEMEKVVYGLEDCYRAAEHGAIDSFLIINSLISRKDSETQDKVRSLLDLLVKTRVNLLIVNERSDNGQIVKKFGGMLGILRYALYES